MKSKDGENRNFSPNYEGLSPFNWKVRKRTLIKDNTRKPLGETLKRSEREREKEIRNKWNIPPAVWSH